MSASEEPAAKPRGILAALEDPSSRPMTVQELVSWLDREHERLAQDSPGVCECGSLLAPDGSCGVRPSTHEALLGWTEE